MAHLADVRDALVNIVANAIYPTGPSNPSAFGGGCKIYAGWPNSTALDPDLLNGLCHVTVYPMAGATAKTTQFLDHPEVIVPAVHGVSASVSGQTITLSGTPGAGEYVTVVADQRHIYSRVGANLAAIIAALLTDAQVDYPSASSNGSALTIPAASLTVRIGAPATMAVISHRQIQGFQVSVWAPSDDLRTACSRIVDATLKATTSITLPDTSQAIVRFSRDVLPNDRGERALEYVHHQIYDVEYATLDQFQAYEITGVTSEADPANTDTSMVGVPSIT